jgi:hypothetical protein
MESQIEQFQARQFDAALIKSALSVEVISQRLSLTEIDVAGLCS